jgi:hypothetical protein
MDKNTGMHDLRHEEMLDFSRQNMISALQLFFSHTKYSLTLLTTILGSSLAIAAFSFDKLQGAPDESKAALWLTAIFLILMGPVSYITYRLVGRYYRLYVSFYVYAARLHEKYSSSIEHPWFADLKSRLGDAFQAVEAALKQEEVPINQRISVADFSLRTPWADCFCSTTEGWCFCVSR